MKNKELTPDLTCNKCHSHKVWLDDDGLVQNVPDACYFVTCAECGFSREATEDDFVD